MVESISRGLRDEEDSQSTRLIAGQNKDKPKSKKKKKGPASEERSSAKSSKSAKMVKPKSNNEPESNNQKSNMSKLSTSSDVNPLSKQELNASKMKMLEKGLSPPKESPLQKKKPEESKSDGIEIGEFDKTQWEFTRFRQVLGDDNIAKEGAAAKAAGDTKAPVGGGAMLRESNQKMLVRGEQLKKRPILILVLLLIELMLNVCCALVWATASTNPPWPQILAVCNLIIIFLLLSAILAIEFFRFQVCKKESSGGQEVGYWIPYRWRFTLFDIHLARAVLVCACLTIMVLDDDFDPGSIIALAILPVQIIFIIIHLIMILKPNRK